MDISRHRVDFWIKNNAIDVSIKEIDGEVALHWHEFYEIEIVLEGKGIYSIDGVDYPLGTGSLFFMSPSSCHSIRFTENTRLINLMFVLDACEADFLYGLFEAVPHMAAKLSGSDLQFLHTLAEEMVKAKSLPYLSAMLNSMLGKIKALCEGAQMSVKSNAMQYAVLYVQNHFKEHIRLEDVARTVNYAPNYFGNKFKLYTGVPFKSYVLNLQFSLAEKLLEYTTLSVTEICYRCGFCDFSNFMTYFKKRYGTTPKEYRRRLSAAASTDQEPRCFLPWLV